MIVKRDEGDLHIVYRPFKVCEFYGQSAATLTIRNGLDNGDLPNGLLISGPIGTGKTTLSRIIGMGLLCENGPTSNPCCECNACESIIRRASDVAYREYHPVLLRTKKEINNLHDRIGNVPETRKRQVFVFESSHELPNDLQTQLSAKLLIEDPDYYMVFCSTNPESVSIDLKEECTALELDNYTPAEITMLLRDVCKLEGIQPEKKIVDSITAKAGDNLRQALMLLRTATAVGDLTAEEEKHIIRKKGGNNVIVVAPHGAGGDKDDDFTDIIAWEIYNRLNCYAVINEKYGKDDVDLNRIDKILNSKDKDIESEFLNPIRAYKNEIKSKGLDPLIIYIHGIEKNNINKWGGEKGQILIGYGQGGKANKKRPHSLTLNQSDRTEIKKVLTAAGLNSEFASLKSGYCARLENNLNQLFKSGKRKGYYDPTVRSVQLEIRSNNRREKPEQAIETGYRISESLRSFLQFESSGTEKLSEAEESFLSESKIVRLSDIELGDNDDLNYIFRFYEQNDPALSSRYESEITEMANSIKTHGLLHPLVLLKKDDGKYKLLCGFRRYKALAQLETKEVQARIYKETDLIHSQCLHISLEENTKRRNLNPIEIGAFLDSAKGAGNSQKTLVELGKEYGNKLGIGPSHGSINKYLKLHEMRVKGQSPEIINDLLKREIPFGIAAEVLAFMNNVVDRNALYEKVIKPLRPTRPQLKQIIDLLKEFGDSVGKALNRDDISTLVKQAEWSDEPVDEFINLLNLKIKEPSAIQKKEFVDQVKAIRKKYMNGASIEEFDVIPSGAMEKNELTLQFRINDENFSELAPKIKKMLNKNGEIRKLLDSVVSP